MPVRLFVSGALLTALAGWTDRATAQAPADSLRVVLETGATCHAKPDAQGAIAGRYHVGDTVHASQWTEGMGRRTWYFDQWRVMGVSPSCWIDGRLTVPLDFRRPEAAYVALADHLLARTGVPFAEYVELINKLETRQRYEPNAKSIVERYPALAFKRLQLIDGAAQMRSRLPEDYAPLRDSWINAHRDVLVYFGSGDLWYVPAERYWSLAELNKDAPWADDAVWAGTQVRDGEEECYADCHLSMIMSRPQEYWKRFPSGKYIVKAIGMAEALAAEAIVLAKQEPDMPPTRRGIDAVRTSLAPVSVATKAHLVDLLKQLESFVKK
jgi:hypothetical protein